MFDETRTTGQLTAQDLSPQEPNSPDTVDDVGSDVLEIVLKDNWISQHQREMLERPENYLRQIRVREELEACTRGRRRKCYPAAILVGDVIRARLSPKRF